MKDKIERVVVKLDRASAILSVVAAHPGNQGCVKSIRKAHRLVKEAVKSLSNRDDAVPSERLAICILLRLIYAVIEFLRDYIEFYREPSLDV